MKRILALAIVLVVSAAGLYFAQRRTRQDGVSTNAVVDMAADWQRDISRAPMRFTRLSDAEEIRIGDDLAGQYTAAQPPLSPEAQATQLYLDEVGSKLAAHAKRKLAYHFHLISNPDLINAFALPGGHVFVGQGLLDRITSEDELAFVLGHEIEHIDHYHSAERVQIAAQLKHINLDVIAEIASIPMSFWQAGYSKNNEFEADREGLRLAVASGYSAQGAVKVTETLMKLHREYVIHAETPPAELSDLAIEGLNGYFRSHPLPSERLAQINEVIAEDHFSTKEPLKPLHLDQAITGATK